IAVVVVSMFFISSAYSKWRSTPVILSLNPEPTSITEDPFPAVTICNLNQALKSKAKSYKKNTTEYEILKIICGHKSSVKNASVPINDWKKLDQVIIDVSQPCSRLLISCRFGAINYDCKTIFRPIVTDAGLCCVFNMVHPEFMYIPDVNNIENISYTDGSTPVDWDPEHGYPKNLPPQYYPRTAVGTGENLGFTVMLNLEPDEYYCSSSNGMGFKIFLHSPTETPHVKEVGLFLAAGMESKLRIHAEKFETDLKLRSMRKDYRKCLFDTEGDLVYFSYYTKRNCEMECLTNMIMKHCGCVTYYMPR
ncbi:pickpocket protein 28-like, partial [Teleopsis dalmanni]